MTGDGGGPTPGAPVWDLRNLVGDLAERTPAAPSPTPDGGAATGEGDTATGEGDTATGEGDTATGEGDAATGEGDTATGAGGAATGEGDAATGAGGAATGAGGAATGDDATGAGGAAVGAVSTLGNGPVVAAGSGTVAELLTGAGLGIGRGGRLPRIAGLVGVMVLVALTVSAAVVVAAGDGSGDGADPAAELSGAYAAEPTTWRSTDTDPATAETPAAPAKAETSAGWTETPGWATAPAGAESTAEAEAAALATLHELRLGDQPLIRLDGRYAAQLASKSVGIVDPRQVAANGSHTFYAVDILAEHRRIRAEATREAPVVLLLSTDVGKRQLYRGQPLWITVALLGADRPAEVVAWCAARFPELTGAALTNRCLPRRLEP